MTANAAADPTSVSVTPPKHARFLAGQRFDLRVEGKGTGPFSATLSIDGVAQSFTSGAQNTTTTDGITSTGFGGFNLRGYSQRRPGMHTIAATFTDATGTVRVESKFEIIDASGDRPTARNIVIMLGDGMGVAHRTAARLVKFGVTAGDPNGYLAMDEFPATGIVTAHSLNSIVSDSAPGMACYSTGAHSKGGQEGVYPANMVSPFYYPRVEYMAEFLHRTKGTVLGLVTTADLEDATPGANAVHTGNRNAGTGIVDQYFDEGDIAGSGAYGTGLRVLLGGGRRWFLPSDQLGSSRAESNDYAALPPDLLEAWSLPPNAAGNADPTRDLLTEFQTAGFAYADTSTTMKSIMGASRPPTKLLGLFGYGNMNVALDKLAKRRNVPVPGTTTFTVDDYHAPDQPMLDEMTDAALKVLNYRNPNGFVLLVEAAHTDKQSHLMDAERTVDEVIEFDRAVAVARNFAQNIDRRTLVVVASDHETAGFSIIGALNTTIANAQVLPPDGTATDPATAPARQKVVGTYDDAGFPQYRILPDGYPETLDVDGKILFGFGANGDRYETWLTKPRPVIDSLLPANIKSELTAAGYPSTPAKRSTADGFFIRGQAIGQDHAVHTASDVLISAYAARGPMAEQFVGVQRNTDVFVKMMRAALGGY
ncbi:MAG: alkaline phosphatase [Polyangiaceae bacterium]